MGYNFIGRCNWVGSFKYSQPGQPNPCAALAAAAQLTEVSAPASLPDTAPVSEVAEGPLVVEVDDVSMDDLSL